MPLFEHRGRAPVVDPSAYVAPTAVLCGDVRVGPDARVLFGAVVTAEDGTVELGARCVVMEQALVRGRAASPARLADDVLVGPHAHVNGADVGQGCFLATGSALFPGARLGAGAEVRIHGVVHVNTALEPGAVVPIGWVGGGRSGADPAAGRARRDLGGAGGPGLPGDGLRASARRGRARADGAPGRLVRCPSRRRRGDGARLDYVAPEGA